MIQSYEIHALQDEIEEYVHGFGLDFFPVVFQVLDFEQMNEVASYGGFPTRYPHWSFGMEYERLHKGYDYGLSKIYEMVVNTNPCYAYLLECNNLVDQKMVMAHVYAHCDFFKSNMWFSKTNRKMMDEIANHATRVQRCIDKYGLEPVERFLEYCLSLDNLIDYHSLFITRRDPVPRDDFYAEERDARTVQRFASKDYMDSFMNPPDFLEEQGRKLQEKRESKTKVPEQPEKDGLLFLIENAPLTNWQQDLLSIVREEAYYFAPQGQTKIMNEGWATYWHSKIMTTRLARDSDIIDYAEHHAGTLGRRPGSINPYKLGVELWRDIENRWNKGRFGKEYAECDDIKKKREWDTGAGLGKAKIFETRKLYNDVGFIDAFLTPEFCAEHRLFTYEYNPEENVYEIAEREYEAIKQKLLFNLTNFGQPFIFVEDADYRNRGELYLKHRYEGVGLLVDQARDTLRNLYEIWKRPVHLETVMEDWNVLMTYDGAEHTKQELGAAA